MRRTTDGIYLNQSCYIKLVLKEHDMSHTSHVAAPLPSSSSYDTSVAKPNEKHLKEDDHMHYRSIVDALSYLAIRTRPDISYAVSILSRQLHTLVQRHFVLAKWMLRYNVGTADRAILLSDDPQKSKPLTAFADVD